ncbi:ring finger domain-containing protein [Ditylenchus destructor]|uniref:Ring finger domain-containing protein n=1 Tax=Ditylenchus destructor TaxID=166010 RepID=A0AAD4MQS4_9BILA|nr:ring finger domain-containing protein [Ditylenchus destructor]
MAPTSCSLNNCIICHELLLEEQACCLSCGHVFHSPCIRIWMKGKRKCPICQKGVTVQGIRKLYFTREEGECQCSTAIVRGQKLEIERLKRLLSGSKIQNEMLGKQIDACDTEKRRLMDQLQRKETEIAKMTNKMCVIM